MTKGAGFKSKLIAIPDNGGSGKGN